MATPLNFKSQRSGGAYGTHPSSGSNSGSNGNSSSNQNVTTTTSSMTARRRTSASEYGPFSSPHASFDDPLSFPPYAELPFTALKRRKQLQENNSFVKWAMRGVLLSPVVVLVLWSVVAIVFTGHNNASNSNTVRTSNSRQQSRRGAKRMLPPNLGSTGSQAGQSPIVYMQPASMAQQQQPQQQLQENPNYGSNGNNMNGMMMLSPQQQSQVVPQLPDQYYMATANAAQLNPEQYMARYQQQQLQQQSEMQQGNPIPVLSPSATAQTMQQQSMQQQSQVGYRVPQGMIPDQAYLATNLQDPGLQGRIGASRPIVMSRAYPRASLDEPSALTPILLSAGQPIMTSSGSVQQIQGMDVTNMIQSGISNNEFQPDSIQQQLPHQLSDLSTSTVEQQQLSPVKQAIYFYDPKDTTLAQNGDILQLPKVVYDANGKAIPLSDLGQVPIYMQPPLLGAAVSSDSLSAADTSSNKDVESSAGNLDIMQVAPALEAVKLPKWGDSSSQDQTVIVATVAVMALLVGALSARRLRSKSFLASCIENETLEDDLAYDSAYTTTAGADSSYNTFGGWKGDLEKFDV